MPSLSLPQSRVQSSADDPVVTLHAIDIAALVPSSAVPISAVLASVTLPQCLRDALHAVHPSARASIAGSKQRLALAVTLAVHAHTGRADVLARPKSVLQEAMSTSVEPAGRRLVQGPATMLSLALGFTSALPMLLQPTNFERVDIACRILLRALFLSPSSAAVALGTLYDAYRPSDIDVTSSLPSFAQLHSAVAVRRFIPIPILPAFTFPSPSTSLQSRDLTLSPLLGASIGSVPKGAPSLRSVRVAPTDGTNSQCFYIAVANALGIASESVPGASDLRWPVLNDRIRSALASIDSAPLLASYSFDLDPTAGIEELNRAKEAYLSNADFTRQQWGGSREMYLLSHFHSGQLAFRTFNSVAKEKDEWRFLCAPSPTTAADAAASAKKPCDLAEKTCRFDREITLHHCAYRGGNNTNHFEQIIYTLSDGASLSEWRTSPNETSEVRDRRFRLIHDGCKQSRIRTIAAAALSEKKDAAVASAIQHQYSTASKRLPNKQQQQLKQGAAPVPVQLRPTRPPIPHRPSTKTSAAAAPTATTSSISQSQWSLTSPSTPYQPPPARANVWRELPSSCRSRFLAVALPLFERYGKLSSRGQFDRCAAVLNLMLDLPTQTLLRRGHVRELKQTLEQQMERFTSLLAAAAGDEIEQESLPPSIAPSSPLLSSLPPLTQSNSPSVDSSAVTADPECCDGDDDAITPPDAYIDDDDDSMVSESIIRRAVGIVYEGAPRAQRRAFRSLSQAPLAPLNEHTVQQLRNLHPVATERMCAVPANKALEIAAIDQKTLFTLLKRRVNNGSAPGPSGWTGSHLQLIADSQSDEAKNGFALLIRDICNGVFGGATQERLLASVLMPIGKKDGRSVRPIAMGEVLVKLAAHYCMSLIEKQLPTLFPRIQFGVKRAGGSEAAAQLTRALFAQSRRLHDTTVALKTDFANAFNAASRARIWDTLLKHPETEPLWRMFHWSYSNPSALLLYDRNGLHSQLESSEGVRQGDPFAAFAFALSVQPLYEKAIADMPECHAVSIQDDLTLIGPAEQVFAAYDRIVETSPSYHLTLRVEKCAVYLPDSLSEELSRVEIIEQCTTRQLAHSNSLESLGVMLGNDSDVQAHCEERIDALEQCFKTLRHPSMPVQVAFLLLRSCALPSLSFLTRTTPPELLLPSAQRFDELVRSTFFHIMGLLPDRIAKSRIVSAEQLQTMISLPLKRGGMGLRPAERISASAYFASAASILPDFLRAFPAQSNRSYSDTELHQQLEACRSLMKEQGVTSAPSPSPTDVIDPSSDEATLTPASPSKSRKRGRKSAAADAAPSASQAASASKDDSALMCSVDQLWSVAASLTRTEKSDSQAFLQSDKLQRRATEIIEEKALTQLKSDSTLRRRTLLTANSTLHSSTYLTVLPTQPLYRMGNASLKMAVRHRLGVLPYDSMESQQCMCRFHTAFTSDPDHFHSCEKFKRTLLTQRHNNIVQVLQDLAVTAGFTAIREPNSHVRPEAIAAQANLSKEYNHHADLLLLRHGMKLYIDVTVTRPTNETMLRSAPQSVSTKQLYSTRRAAHGKHAKYDEIARVNEYRMVPFAVETYGGIGAEATTLLHTMAAHSTEYSPAEFLTHAHARLSVALQSSNADIAQLGIEQLHLRQHAGNPYQFDAHQRERDRRNAQYAQPANGDQLHRRVSLIVQAADAKAAADREEEAIAAADESALAFLHERRVGFADVRRIISPSGTVHISA